MSTFNLFNLSLFTMFCCIILLLAIVQRILRNIGKEKWANFLHYTVLLHGLLFLGRVFFQLVYLAEEMFYR